MLFTTTAKKNKHTLEVHENMRRFKCTQCDHTFTRGDHLRNHIKSIHIKEKSYVCSVCDFSFSRADGLKLHFKRESGGLNANCANIHFILVQV